MKLKKGFTWKSIEGPAKGQEFCIVDVAKTTIQYKCVQSGQFYEEDRKNFEKRMERVAAFWNKSNKEYKAKKNELHNS